MPDSLLDRIETVPLSVLTPHPGNARRGDIAAIAESLRENRQFLPLVVQRSTGHILKGNQTFQAAVSMGWGQIDVVYVDVDDRRATKILLADNRTADLGSYEDDPLATLLSGLDDFIGTGYCQDDLDALIVPVFEDDGGEELFDGLRQPFDKPPMLRLNPTRGELHGFYELTEDAPDKGNDGRFTYLLTVAGWVGE